MGKKIFSLFLMILLSLTVVGCGIINVPTETGGGTVHVDVNLDDVFLNVESQIPKTALTEDITLPTNFGSVTISWESGNTSIIDNNGHIVRPETDTDVYLTCTLTSGADSKTYRVRVTIKAKEKAQTVTIADVLNGVVGASYKTQGVVVAYSKQGALIKDNSGMIYIYGAEEFSYASIRVGSLINVEGVTSVYGGKLQFSKPTVTLVSSVTYTYPTARELNVKTFDALFSETAPIEYVKFEGKLTVSGNYTNIVVQGANYTGSLVYPVVDYSSLNGKTVTVEGFFVYTSGSRYINFLATNVTEKSALVATIPQAYQGVYEGTDSEGHSMRVEVLESSVKVTDPTGKVMSYTLYQDDTGYYFVDDGQKVYSTFTDTSVTNAYGTFTKKTEDTPVAAHIPATQQGEYEGYDSDQNYMTVVVSESSAKVIVDGRVLDYNLYEDSQGIYFIEESNKAYCTFGDGTVTNKYGTFTKKTEDTPVAAHIPATQQGEYEGYDSDHNHMTVEVFESSVKVSVNVEVFEYDLYEDSQGIYFMEGSNKAYCTFGDGTVTNKYGTFTKKSTTPTEPTLASVPQNYQGVYENPDSDVTATVSESALSLAFGEIANSYPIYAQTGGGYYILDRDTPVTLEFVGKELKVGSVSYIKKQTIPTDPIVAKISEDYQGEYENETTGVKATVSESTLVLTGEAAVTYTIYAQTGGGYYILDRDTPVTLEFVDKELKVGNASYIKKTTTPTTDPIVAKVPEVYQGEYENETTAEKAIVYETTIQLGNLEYVIYAQTGGGYYILYNNTNQTLEFVGNELKIGNMAFIKKTTTPTTDPVPGTIPSERLGTYRNTAFGDLTLTESAVVIGPNSYQVYILDNQLYIIKDGANTNITFVSANEFKLGDYMYALVSTEPGKNPAHLTEAQQGEYEGLSADGAVMTLILSESQAKVLVNGTVIEYDLYVDDQGIYFMDGSEKAYSTFTDNKVTNKFGTFTKKGTTPSTPTEAKVPEDYQGEYENETTGVKATVSESTLVLTGEAAVTYTIYAQTGGGYYILDRDTSVTLEFVGKELKVGNASYIKKTTTPTTDPVPGTIPSERLGTYRNTAFGDLTLTESAVVIGTTSYPVYVLDNQLYIIRDGANTNITFVSANEFKLGDYMYALVSTEPGKNPAHLTEAQQGEYEGLSADGAVMTLILSESQAKVLVNGSVIEYDLYVDDQGIYFMDEGKKEYSTFGDGTVTNKYGTFTKKTASTPVAAHIPTDQQGIYVNADDTIRLEVAESALKIHEGTFQRSYPLYEDSQGIYYVDNDKNIYVTFGSNSTITFEKGTFTKYIEVETEGEGTETSPFTVSDVYAMAGTMPNGGTITGYFTGKVSADPTDGFVFYLADDSNKFVTVTGLMNADGTTSYTVANSPIAKDDVVVLNGQVTVRGTTYSLRSPKLVKVTKAEVTPEEPTLATIPEEYQGVYENTNKLQVEIFESAFVYGKDEGATTFVIYVTKDGAYYFNQNGQDTNITFGADGTVQIGRETFTKVVPVEEPVEATFAAEYRGKYENETVTVMVYDSPIVYMREGISSSGNKIYYTESDGYYMTSKDEKIHLVFSENGLTIDGYGLIPKVTETEATINEFNQGTYINLDQVDSYVVTESMIFEIFPDGETASYTIYKDANGYYYNMLDGLKVYFSFSKYRLVFDEYLYYVNNNIATEGDGIFTNPFTVRDINFFGAWMENGKTLQGNYFFTGTVVNIEAGEEEFHFNLVGGEYTAHVFALYSQNGLVQYNENTAPVEAGDMVKILAQITKLESGDLLITGACYIPTLTAATIAEEYQGTYAEGDQTFVLGESTITSGDYVFSLFLDENEEIYLYNASNEMVYFYVRENYTIEFGDVIATKVMEYDTVGAGTKENPFTVGDIYTVAEQMKNGSSLNTYYFKGKMGTNIREGGSFYLNDSEVNIYVDSLSNSDGTTRYTVDNTPVSMGSIIVVQAIIYKNDIGEVMLVDAFLISAQAPALSNASKSHTVDDDGWNLHFEATLSEALTNPTFEVDLKLGGYLLGDDSDEENFFLQAVSDEYIETSIGNGKFIMNVTIPAELATEFTSVYYLNDNYKGTLYAQLLVNVYDGEGETSEYVDNFASGMAFFNTYLDVVETEGSGTLASPLTVDDANKVGEYLPNGIYTNESFYVAGKAYIGNNGSLYLNGLEKNIYIGTLYREGFEGVYEELPFGQDYYVIVRTKINKNQNGFVELYDTEYISSTAPIFNNPQKSLTVDETGWNLHFDVELTDVLESPNVVIRQYVIGGYPNGEASDELWYEVAVNRDIVLAGMDENTFFINVHLPNELVQEFTSEYYLGPTYKGGLYVGIILDVFDGESTVLEDYFASGIWYFNTYLDVVETEGEGTLESPLTVTDAVNVSEYLPASVYTKAKFYITGVVSDFPTKEYCNFHIVDEENNEILVYGLQQTIEEVLVQYGSHYNNINFPVNKGDTVVLLAQIYNYVNSEGTSIYELKAAELVSVVEAEEPVVNPYLSVKSIVSDFTVNNNGSWTLKFDLTLNEAITEPRLAFNNVIAFGYLNGDYANEEAYFEESVFERDEEEIVTNASTNLESGVFYLEVTVSKALVDKYISEYYLNPNKKGGLAVKLFLEVYDGEELVGLNDYNYGTYEFFKSLLDAVETTGNGTLENPLTTADAAALAAYIHPTFTTNETFYVTGVVADEPTSEYCNFNLVIDEENNLYVYGLKTSDGKYSYGTEGEAINGLPIKVGDTIIVKANVRHYMSSGTPLYELVYAKLIKVNGEDATYELIELGE